MARVAVDSRAAALQYGPTEGLEDVKALHRRGDGGRGHARSRPTTCIVTTGGQQVIDLVCKTLLDPGDVVVAEAPDLPGRGAGASAPTRPTSSRSRWTSDGMRIDLLEETLDRLDARGPARRSSSTRSRLPEPRRRDDVARAPAAAGARSPRERELLVLEDNPYGLLRYEGEPLPTLYSLDGGEYVIYLGTFSKILSPGLRLGWAAAPRPVLEKLNLGKQARRPVLLVARPSTSCVAYFAAARLAHATSRTLRELYRRRRDIDARRAGRALPARGDVDAPAGRPVHLGDAARLHRHDRPAGAGAARARRVRARPRRLPRRPRRLVDAAELLRRRRGRHPRGRAADRQGRRRAGRAVRRR